jgi:hypothetical protein
MLWIFQFDSVEQIKKSPEDERSFTSWLIHQQKKPWKHNTRRGRCTQCGLHLSLEEERTGGGFCTCPPIIDYLELIWEGLHTILKDRDSKYFYDRACKLYGIKEEEIKEWLLWKATLVQKIKIGFSELYLWKDYSILIGN